MSPKRLVLVVEGPGDVEAAPVLAKRLIRDISALDTLVLHEVSPLCIHGGYSKIRRNGKNRRVHDFGEWRRYLQVAMKTRKDMGACLLLLDGDSKADVEGKSFCASRAARVLAAEAQKIGAGKLFSLAVVFSCMEFESWLIAGIESLLGKPFSDGRNGIPNILPKNIQIPHNPESAPRDAKGWLSRIVPMGYDAPRDQAELAKLVDLKLIRNRQEIRSFQRMESAIRKLVDAIRSGTHVVTPAS